MVVHSKIIRLQTDLVVDTSGVMVIENYTNQKEN